MSGSAEARLGQSRITQLRGDLSGSSYLEITDGLDVEQNLALNLSGRSIVDLPAIAASAGDFNLSGASELRISHGMVNVLNAETSGSAKIKARLVSGGFASVKARGASSISFGDYAQTQQQRSKVASISIR